MAESLQVSLLLPSIVSYNIRGGFACPGIAYYGGRTMSNGYAQLTSPRPPFASTGTVRE